MEAPASHRHSLAGKPATWSFPAVIAPFGRQENRDEQSNPVLIQSGGYPLDGRLLGLDLGTTNTVLAVCIDREASPQAIPLPNLPGARALAGRRGADAADPSAVELGRAAGSAWAGASAVNRHHDQHSPLPPELARLQALAWPRPHAPVARAKWGDVSATLAGEAFLAVLAGLRDSRYAPTGLWGRCRRSWPLARRDCYPRRSTATSYGRAVRRIARRCGIRRVRSVEEPVAAARLWRDLRRAQTILVLDFGGGTLNLAVVRLGSGRPRRGAGDGRSGGGRRDGGCLAARGSGAGAPAWMPTVQRSRLGSGVGEEEPWPRRRSGGNRRASLVLSSSGFWKRAVSINWWPMAWRRCCAPPVGTKAAAAPSTPMRCCWWGSTLLPGVPECVERRWASGPVTGARSRPCGAGSGALRHRPPHRPGFLSRLRRVCRSRTRTRRSSR